MPRGQPDFGMYAAQTYTAGLADMAELAARLSSINIFDRRGKVVDMDDFESPPFRWIKGGDAGYSIEFDTINSKSGAQCVKLTPNVGAGDEAQLFKRYPWLLSKRTGSEICFAAPPDNACLYVDLDYYTGEKRYLAQAKVDFSDKSLYYLDSHGEEQKIADSISFSRSVWIFHPIKLVADFNTKKYVRVLLEDTWYDLSNYDVYSVGSGVEASQTVWFRLELKTAVAGSIYLDDFILTMDEP